MARTFAGLERRPRPELYGRRKGSLREAAKSAVMGGVANRLVGDQLKHLLKPENMPVDKLLANPSLLNRSIGMLPERCLAIFGTEGDDRTATDLMDAVVAAGGRLGAVDLGPDPGERWFRTRYRFHKMPKLCPGASPTPETAAPWSAVPATTVYAEPCLHVLVMAHEPRVKALHHVRGVRAQAQVDNARGDLERGAGEHWRWERRSRGVGVLKRDFMDQRRGFSTKQHGVIDRTLNVELFPDRTGRRKPRRSTWR